MVLSKQQIDLLQDISRMFPGDKIKISITKNGKLIFPINKKEVRFIKSIQKGLSFMSDKSFVDGRWYECTTGECDPSIGEVTAILDVTKYMTDKIGLPNRKSTEEMMASYLQSLEALPQDFAFIMLDVDNFKAINDTYDHLTGDEVLGSIARMIKSNIRETDIAGRYGGDEMFILLKNISREDAQTKAEELRINAQEVKVYFSGTLINSPTISVGVYPISKEEWIALKSTTDTSGQEEGYLPILEMMIKIADAALKSSKSEGKNKVVIATGVSGEFIPLELSRMVARRLTPSHGRRMDDAQSF